MEQIMNETTAAGQPAYRMSSRQQKLCDFCRIAKKKCVREVEGQRCGECEKWKYICSPSRTCEQFRFLLYGTNGLMLDAKFREDGLREMSEETFRRVKAAQISGLHHNNILHSQQTNDEPDYLDVNQFTSNDWDLGSGAETRFFPGAGAMGGEITPGPSGHVAPASLNLGMLGPSSIPSPPATAQQLNNSTNINPSSNQDFNNGNGQVYIPFEDFTHTSAAVTPGSPLALNACGPNITELFARFDSYRINCKHFEQHLCQLRNHRLFPSKVFTALSDAQQALKAKSNVLAEKIENYLLVSPMDNVAENLWLFHKFVKDVDDYNLPSPRKKAVLMKARSLYRDHGFLLEAEETLRQISKLSDGGDADSDDFYEIYVRSIGETCEAAATAYGTIPDWKLPEGLFPKPFMPIHRTIHHPGMLAVLAANEEHDTDCKDIIGQTILHAAVQLNDAEVLEQCLEALPDLDIEERDLCARTPLFLAASSGCYEASEILLDNGARHEARSVAKHTMVELCAGNGHLNVLKLLHSRGASVHPTQFDGTSTPLQAAAESGHYDVVDWLLKTRQCKIHFRRLEDSKTAKDLAQKNGHSNIVELLSRAS